MSEFANTITVDLSGHPATVSYKATRPPLMGCWLCEPLSIVVDGVDVIGPIGEREYDEVCEACGADLGKNVKVG